MRSESKRRWDPFFNNNIIIIINFAGGAPSTDLDYLYDRFEYEHICWDPKDGELCLNRVKPEETLVEARSDTDVNPPFLFSLFFLLFILFKINK